MLHAGKKVLDGAVEDLKKQRGVDSVRVQFTDSVDPIALPEVTRTRHYGKEQVLELAPNIDPQRVLKQVMAFGQVVSFSVVRPTLHELFVDIAGNHDEPTRQGPSQR
jgi:ABC-2 type transport system ATP-binding protein